MKKGTEKEEELRTEEEEKKHISGLETEILLIRLLGPYIQWT